MSRVLIVEDEQKIARMIADFFLAKGHRTQIANDGETGYGCFLHNTPDLVVLDINLPTTDGFTLCRKLRKISDAPIIILTCLSSLEDQLLGYELRADDYMTKPFNPEVLVAKAEALLRRSEHASNRAGSSLLSLEGIEICCHERTVTVDGEAVDLEPKQFDILYLLMQNRNSAFSREQIMRAVWKYDYYGNIRVVDTQITKLRRQLGAKAHLLETVSGIGYRFNCRQQELVSP